MKLTRHLFFLLFSVSSLNVIGQAINAGFNVGLFPTLKNTYSSGINLEYRPKNAFFSLNTDPFILFNKRDLLFSEPIYLKFVIGKKFRVCPSIGGFLRSNRRYGWLVGLQLEYVIKDKFILFSKNEMYADYWKDKWYNHFGGSTIYINNSKSILVSVGIKMRLNN